MKRKGTKIKRSRKNLYKRRKSTGKKVFEAVILLIVVAALIFVGYSVAPPLIKFFSQQSQQDGQSSAPVWTPPVQSELNSEESSVQSTTAGTQSSKPESSVVTEKNDRLAYAPQSALKNAEALENYLADIKNEGYTGVVFELKNTLGALLYKSSLPDIKDIEDINTGSLSAKAIVNACTASGLTPAASISTLYDRLNPKHLGGGYTIADEDGWGWLDAAADNGGKPWASPFESITSDYLCDICSELSRAGFETIILQNTIFPDFSSYDYSLLDSSVASRTRSSALASVAASCAAKINAVKSAAYVEINAYELLTAKATDYDGTAEILESSAKLGNAQICLKIDTAELLGKELTVSDGKTIKISKDIATAITQIADNSKLDISKAAVRISGELSGSDMQKAEQALEKAGCTNVIFG